MLDTRYWMLDTRYWMQERNGVRIKVKGQRTKVKFRYFCRLIKDKLFPIKPKGVKRLMDIQNEMPKNPKQIQADQDAGIKESLGKIKNKILVMSGKGGVGKTSTSINLSIALANKGFKVGIIDVDLHGPDVPRMLGLEGTPEVNQNKKLNPISYSKNLSAISIESFTPNKDDAIIWRGPLKFSAIRQFIGDVDWGDLDWLSIRHPEPVMNR
jgi:Mrp family chromosome partitioning ATPase